MSDLSNAPFQPALQQPLQSSSTQNLPNFNSFSTDQNAIAQEGAAVTTQLGGGVLAYPLDSPKYVMTFSVQQYKRSTLQTVGQYLPSGYPGIVLPLPEQLVNLSESKWDTDKAGIMNLAASGITGATGGITTRGQGALAGIAGAAGGTIATVGEAFLGATPNQFQVMLYRGPTYKQHDFTWQLSPQNFQEADILRQIVVTFQNIMAPNLVSVAGVNTIPGLGQGLWGFPMIFRCRIYPNSKWLYKFKPMVCTNFAVNYTPTGKASFYRNVNGVVGENPPEAITIKAQFMEMEYWISGNYTSDNDPDSQEDPNNDATEPLGSNVPAFPSTPSAGGGSTVTLPL